MFWNKHIHLSMRELLLTADRELSPRRLARARRHLDECHACRDRFKVMERTLEDTIRLDRVSWPDSRPTAGLARVRLRQRLAEAARAERPFAWPARLSAPVGLGCAALLLAGLVMGVWREGPASQRFQTPDAQLRVFLLPRADLTPGAARPVSASDVCERNGTLSVGPIPASVHEGVFRDYGADYRLAPEYELDHLITPELGGTHDVTNLWPQPFGGTAWNAYVKDELELLFHERVCEGLMDFSTAQREIATDWIAAYKRHFRTDTPLRDYSTSPLTALDIDLLRSELAELGVPIGGRESEGAALLVMLQTARQDANARWFHPKHVSVARGR